MIALLLTLSFAEARKAPADPEPPSRPAVDATPPLPPSPGSLFDEVAARRVMGLDGNARQVGDLITVKIVEDVTTNLGAETKSSRKSSQTAALKALLGMEKTLKKAHTNLEEIGIDIASASEFEGSGGTSREANVEATLTCEVLQVMPGGNLHIWGWKQVRVNRETQYVVLEGYARPRDVRMDNTIDSELLAQAKVEITGSGIISDNQGPGWGSRLINAIWPF